MTVDLLHPADTGKEASRVRWTGLLQVEPAELDRAVRNGWLADGVDGWYADPAIREGKVVLLPKPNLVVDVGVQRSLDRLFNIGTPGPVDSMGVDDGTTNPTAATGNSGATNKRIQAFDAAPTRSGRVVSASSTFTQATVAFVMRRLFLSSGTADAAGSLYAMTNVFSIDLTSFSSWSQTFTAQITGAGT